MDECLVLIQIANERGAVYRSPIVFMYSTNPDTYLHSLKLSMEALYRREATRVGKPIDLEGKTATIEEPVVEIDTTCYTETRQADTEEPADASLRLPVPESGMPGDPRGSTPVGGEPRDQVSQVPSIVQEDPQQDCSHEGQLVEVECPVKLDDNIP